MGDVEAYVDVVWHFFVGLDEIFKRGCRGPVIAGIGEIDHLGVEIGVGP